MWTLWVRKAFVPKICASSSPSGFGVKAFPAFNTNPKGPCTQCLGTWGLGNSHYSIGFG